MKPVKPVVLLRTYPQVRCLRDCLLQLGDATIAARALRNALVHTSQRDDVAADVILNTDPARSCQRITQVAALLDTTLVSIPPYAPALPQLLTLQQSCSQEEVRPIQACSRWKS